MAKDVNIHVKAEGAQQAKQLTCNQVAQATEEMGAKTSRAAGWIKEAFTALIGPLGITADRRSCRRRLSAKLSPPMMI